MNATTSFLSKVGILSRCLVGMTGVNLLLTIAWAGGYSVCAQGRPSEFPKFEVIAIRPCKPDFNRLRVPFTANEFYAESVPLPMLIHMAFPEEGGRVFGLPNWGNASTYTITAKVAERDIPAFQKLTTEERGQMLQVLLEERFNLKFHRELKPMPVYALVIAKNGPKLTDKRVSSRLLSDKRDEAPDGMVFIEHGILRANAISIPRFIAVLSELSLGRPIVDKTQLSGTYTFDLRISEEKQATISKLGDEMEIPDTPVSSIFTSLKNQLGLMLKAEIDPIQTIVVDHIEAPSEN